MKNSLYTPYVTEPVHHFTHKVTGHCYISPAAQQTPDNANILNTNHIISLHNQIATEAGLMIIPVSGAVLGNMLAAPEAWASWQTARLRIGINYAALLAHRASLPELAGNVNFWLYDFAPPGTDWRQLESVPFSGIVLTESFFNDNYEKFTFPFLMAALRERGAEVVVRSRTPLLTPAQFAEINISGWQQQRAEGSVIGC